MQKAGKCESDSDNDQVGLSIDCIVSIIDYLKVTLTTDTFSRSIDENFNIIDLSEDYKSTISKFFVDRFEPINPDDYDAFFRIQYGSYAVVVPGIQVKAESGSEFDSESDSESDTDADSNKFVALKFFFSSTQYQQEQIAVKNIMKKIGPGDTEDNINDGSKHVLRYQDGYKGNEVDNEDELNRIRCIVAPWLQGFELQELLSYSELSMFSGEYNATKSDFNYKLRNGHYAAKSNDPEFPFRLMRELISGLQYLHSKDIIHHDINTYNVFVVFENLNSDSNDKPKYKYSIRIIDYSIAIDENEQRTNWFSELDNMIKDIRKSVVSGSYFLESTNNITNFNQKIDKLLTYLDLKFFSFGGGSDYPYHYGRMAPELIRIYNEYDKISGRLESLISESNSKFNTKVLESKSDLLSTVFDDLRKLTTKVSQDLDLKASDIWAAGMVCWQLYDYTKYKRSVNQSLNTVNDPLNLHTNYRVLEDYEVDINEMLIGSIPELRKNWGLEHN